MRSFKKVLQPIVPNGGQIERFSLRFQNGVEIFEHEVAYTGEFHEPSSAPGGRIEQTRKPRLVVAENAGPKRPIIAKTRSEIDGLISLLVGLEPAR